MRSIWFDEIEEDVEQLAVPLAERDAPHIIIYNLVNALNLVLSDPDLVDRPYVHGQCSWFAIKDLAFMVTQGPKPCQVKSRQCI